MEECGICFYEVSTEKFYDLPCCQNRNRMCKYCLELLVVPLCPFCRTRIPGLPDREDPHRFRGGVSLDTYTVIPPLYFLNPLDDSYLDSRILRRQMKRLRKLQERERHAEANRRINYTMNEQRRRQQQQQQQQHRRNAIQQQIREEMEIFNMEDNNA